MIDKSCVAGFRNYFPNDEFEASRGLWNISVIISGDGEDKPVLWVATKLLLFRLNYQAASGGTEYTFLWYIGCTLALDEMRKGWCVRI